MKLLDGLINFVSRIGTGQDKTVFGQYVAPLMNQVEIDAAYRTTWFRKIVDIPPFDEVREWRTWTGADQEQITLIDDEEKRLGVRQKVAEARTRARKDGGAVIIIGAGRGQASTELKVDSIGTGGVRFLTVLSRWDVTPGELERDPESPYFDQPKTYQLRGSTGNGIDIHPSRVIRFLGNPTRAQNAAIDGWADSVWAELRDVVRNADSIAANIAALVHEAKLDIIRIKGLMGGLASKEYEDLLVKRMTALNALKSSLNALLIDAEDEFEQKTIAFAGFADIWDRSLMLMSGIADIPATRLFGRSPQGMNATGDSDMRNYYDRIKAGQVLHLGPALYQLDECLLRSALGARPKEIFYEWNPLYSLTEKEAAEVEKSFAETLKIYADSAMLPDTAIAQIAREGIIERGQMPGAEQAFDEADAEGEVAGITEEPTEAELAAEAAAIATSEAVAKDPSLGLGGGKNKLNAKDATPRSLYVSRAVVNADEIRAWAKSQGFATSVEDMHVTIAHSHTPVDWMDMGDAWSFGRSDGGMEIAAGGPRVVEALGPNGAIVLQFISTDLQWRHQAMRERGASWAFGEFVPHITITYDKGGVNLEDVKPYSGRIVLGPELFEELSEGEVEHPES